MPAAQPGESCDFGHCRKGFKIWSLSTGRAVDSSSLVFLQVKTDAKQPVSPISKELAVIAGSENRALGAYVARTERWMVQFHVYILSLFKEA